MSQNDAPIGHGQLGPRTVMPAVVSLLLTQATDNTMWQVSNRMAIARQRQDGLTVSAGLEQFVKHDD